MPDDEDVIRVGMEGDPSSYLAALQKMHAATQETLGKLEVRYQDTMAKIALSTQVLNGVVSSINKQFGEGSAQLPTFTDRVKKYEDEVIAQTQVAQELRMEILKGNEALKEQARLIAATQTLLRTPPPQPTPQVAAPTPSSTTIEPVLGATPRPTQGMPSPVAFDMELTEKRLKAIASAEELVQRQAKTLADIEKDVAASVGLSAQEMGGLYVRATTEMGLASSALINAQKELGPSAAAGAAEAIAAIDSLEGSYIRAATVAGTVKGQIQQLATSEKSQAESSTGLSVATQQHTAATELLSRQEQTLVSIRNESQSSTLTSVEAQSLYKRALAESSIAVNSLTTAQKTIGPAAAAGDAEAVAALEGFAEAYQRASAVVDVLKGRISLLNQTQVQSVEASDQAALGADRLAEAQRLVVRQSQTLVALQREIAGAVGSSASQMGALYVRAMTEMRVAQTALTQSQRDIGPAAASGSAEAQAALESLQQSYIDSTAVVAELKVQIAQLTESERASAEAASAQATAHNQLVAAQEAAIRQTAVLNAMEKDLASASKLTSQQLGTYYVRAAYESRLATTNLAQAQKTLGAAAAAGSAEAVTALNILKENQQQAAAYAGLLKLQIEALSSSEEANASTATKNAQAHNLQAQAMRSGAVAAVEAAGGYEELGYSSYKAMASSRALASEAGLGGVGYALSRVGSMSRTLGPLLEAALPVALAVGMGEAVYELSKKAYEYYQNLILVKEGMDEVDKASEKMGKDSETAFEKGEQAAIAHLKRVGQEVGAAKREVALEESKPIDLTFGFKTDKDFETKLKDLSAGQRETAKGVLKEIIPSELPDELQQVNIRLDEVNAGLQRVKARRKEVENEANQLPGGLSLNPYAAGQELQLKRQENQLNVQRSLYDRLRQVVTTNIESRKDIIVHEEDQVNEAQGKEMIRGAEEQIELMKSNGTYTKQAEISKWREVIKETERGTAEYRTAEQKIASVMGKGPTDRQREAEIRKQDQDALTEMRLHADEIGGVRSSLLKQEEAFVRERIIIEKKYVDNVRSLRAELVRILKEEEQDRIHTEGQTAEGMFTSKGKPDYTAQLNFWNTVATQAKEAKNAAEEYSNAVAHAQRAGGESIRQTSEEIKKEVTTQYETWVTEGHRTEAEIIKFWSDVKGAYSADAPLVEEAIHRISEATAKLRAETAKLREVEAQRQEIEIVGGLEIQKLQVKREYDQGQIQGSFNPFAESGADKEHQIIGRIELEELDSKRDMLQKEMDAVRASMGEENAQYQELVNKKIQLDQQYASKSYELESARLLSIREKYQEYFNTVNRDMEKMVNDGIDGNHKWGEDFRKMILDLEKQFADFIIKTALLWAENKVLNAVLHVPPPPSQVSRGDQQKTGPLGRLFGGDGHTVALESNTKALEQLTLTMGSPINAGTGAGTGPTPTVGASDTGQQLVSMAVGPTSIINTFHKEAATPATPGLPGPFGQQLPGAPEYQGKETADTGAAVPVVSVPVNERLTTPALGGVPVESTSTEVAPPVPFSRPVLNNAGFVEMIESRPKSGVGPSAAGPLIQPTSPGTGIELSAPIGAADVSHKLASIALPPVPVPNVPGAAPATQGLPGQFGPLPGAPGYIVVKGAEPTPTTPVQGIGPTPGTPISTNNAGVGPISIPVPPVPSINVSSITPATPEYAGAGSGESVAPSRVAGVGADIPTSPQAIEQKLVSMALSKTSIFGPHHEAAPATKGMSGPFGIPLPGAPEYTGTGGGTGVGGGILGGIASVGTSLIGPVLGGIFGKNQGTAVGSGAPGPGGAGGAGGAGGGGIIASLNADASAVNVNSRTVNHSTEIENQNTQAINQLNQTMVQKGQQGGGQGSGGGDILGSLLGGGGGGEGGGGAQKTAQTISSNVMTSTSNANAAAAYAFETAMESLPFPVNVATAPVVAAQALAEGMVFASGAAFKEGGIVPGAADVAFPAVLHGKEMVLPEHLSTGIQNIISEGNTNNSSVKHTNQKFALNYSPNDGGGKSPSHEARGMMKEVRRMSKTFNR